MNGILKTEFNLYSSSLSFDDTCQIVAGSIKAYNELRPHASCNYLTPAQAHGQTGILQKQWKNYYQPVKNSGQAKTTPKPKKTNIFEKSPCCIAIAGLLTTPV